MQCKTVKMVDGILEIPKVSYSVEGMWVKNYGYNICWNNPIIWAVNNFSHFKNKIQITFPAHWILLAWNSIPLYGILLNWIGFDKLEIPKVHTLTNILFPEKKYVWKRRIREKKKYIKRDTLNWNVLHRERWMELARIELIKWLNCIQLSS